MMAWVGKKQTVASLRALLMRIGSATSGRRDELIHRISKDVQTCRVPDCDKGGLPSKTRILSIDMGIRNLAFCVAEITTEHVKSQQAHMHVLAWRRLDVAEEVSNATRSIVDKSSAGLHEGIDNEMLVEFQDEETGHDPYSPAALSHTAHALLHQTLLPYKPDIILIERQRWRSAGGPAIQQWTVRVNTLEGMLWAILTTVRAARAAARARPDLKARGDHPVDRSLYEVYGVDPRRVGNFWLQQARVDGPGEDGDVIKISKSTTGRVSRAKAEKKAKINLVRSWVAEKPYMTDSAPWYLTEDLVVPTTMSMTFSQGAELTRSALCAVERTAKGRTRGTVNIGGDLKKADDVVDCLLQAAAWTLWEKNRRYMKGLWSENAHPARVHGETETERKGRATGRKASVGHDARKISARRIEAHK